MQAIHRINDVRDSGRAVLERLCRRWVCAGLLVCLVVGRSIHGAEIDFARDVRPILSENCFLCHGPDDGSRATDLRLDTPAGLRALLDGQPVAKAGDPEGSLLFQRVTSDDPDLKMPPAETHKTLTPQQIEILRRWIETGAEYRDHWSFRPIGNPVPPQVSRPEWQASPIDAFVLARLEREGLAPSPLAEPRQLLRRVSLDLTGLPPTPEELEAFLSDPSPQAYAHAVDRLLASPAYGERMAWDWLDAARYADTNGYQGDNERTMWPWRDWVVSAFHQNQPFDQFTVDQLAGDLIPDATIEQRLATGFSRNHMINGEGGRIAEENRVDYVMDMSETMGTVWLGLTLNCCRCHDHKFDPLSKQDYFALFAFFNQTPVTGGGGDPRTAPVLPVYSAVQRAEQEQIDRDLAEVRRQLAERLKTLQQRQPEWEANRLQELADQSWMVLVPQEVQAEQAELSVLPDHSVLAGGPNPDNDSYRIRGTLPLEIKTVAALRVEALRHESLNKNSLARSDSGNFVLTDVRFQRPAGDASTESAAGENGAAEAFVDLPFRDARATFEQGNHTAKAAIDDRSQTGWAVWEGRLVDREHAAVFVLQEPVAVGGGLPVTVLLRHQSPHSRHNLGRFRLSVSSDPDAAPQPGEEQLRTALRIKSEERSKEQRALVQQALTSSDEEYRGLAARIDQLQDRRKKLADSVPQVMVMADMPEPRKTFQLERGLYNQPGVEVPAAVPAVLPGLPDDAPRNRLGLARWLVAEENPLTARVTVNRLWQQVFGIALVKTVEDFGVQGEIPEHAELLDWLAHDFRTHGWDVRRLMKQIVMSRTYRQSSRVTSEWYERDPENRLLARGARFRLPSWMLRDQALAVSGLLTRTVGGPPVNSYQPAGVWEEATFGNKKYRQDQGESLYRRSLYTFWRRIVGPTMFFDNAARQVCTVKAVRTNTPLHSLTTMNDVTYVEAARALAERVLTSTSDDDKARLDMVYRRVLSRSPSGEESQIFLEGLSRARGEFEAQPELAARLLAMGESPRDATLAVTEHAAWASLCLAVLNLDETLSKE